MAGVKIYERRDALLHVKSAVIDGVWSTVGSTNLDWRSFLHNQEVNVVILGGNFGEKMREVFLADQAQAQRITLQRLAAAAPERALQGATWATVGVLAVDERTCDICTVGDHYRSAADQHSVVGLAAQTPAAEHCHAVPGGWYCPRSGWLGTVAAKPAAASTCFWST